MLDEIPTVYWLLVLDCRNLGREEVKGASGKTVLECVKYQFNINLVLDEISYQTG